MKKTLLLAGVACLLSANANAADFIFKPYVGIDYTYSKLKYDNIKGTFNGMLVLYNSDNMKDTNNSLSLIAGAKFHPNFGAEIFYQKSDKQDKSTYDYEWDMGAKFSTKFTAYGLDAIGYLPVAQNVELLGAAGLAKYEVKGKISGDILGSGNEDGLGYRLGVGAQYNFNDHIAARAMARYVLMDHDWLKNMAEVSLGIRYTF